MWAMDEYDIFLLTEMLYNYSADEKYAGKLRETILIHKRKGLLKWQGNKKFDIDLKYGQIREQKLKTCSLSVR